MASQQMIDAIQAFKAAKLAAKSGPTNNAVRNAEKAVGDALQALRAKARLDATTAADCGPEAQAVVDAGKTWRGLANTRDQLDAAVDAAWAQLEAVIRSETEAQP